MATYYWVGGAGTWDASTTTNWSLSSGGTGSAGVPTSVDDVVFNSASNATAYAVTVGTNAVCKNMTVAGPASGNVTFTLGATAVLTVYGSFTLPATGCTWTPTTGANITFASTSTGNTVTTNGVSLGATSVTFNGSGGGWTLGSAITTTVALTASQGTFATGNYNVTASQLSSSVSTTRSISLGSSTITLSGTGTSTVSLATTTGLTWNAGTSTITMSGANPTLAGGGLTFYNVAWTGTGLGTLAVTGANTYNNLTISQQASAVVRNINFGGNNQTINGTFSLGNPTDQRFRTTVYSGGNTADNTVTLTVATMAAFGQVNFRSITAAGTSSPWSGTNIGNGGNNTNISFAANKTVYVSVSGGASTTWETANIWATSSGGTGATSNFPLPQDTIYVDNNSVSSGNTLTISYAWWIGALTFANRTTPITFATGASAPQFYNNLTLSASVTPTGTGGYAFLVNNATLNTAGVTLPVSVSCQLSSAYTFTLAGNVTTTSTSTNPFQLYSGNFVSNSYNITTPYFVMSTQMTSAAFGTSTITVTGSGATVVNCPTSAVNITGTPTINCNYSGSTGTRTILVSGYTGGGLTSLPINITAGSDIVTFPNSSEVSNLNFTGFTGAYNPTGTLIVTGNLTFVSGMTVGSIASVMTFGASSGTQTITTAGITLDMPITQNAPSATLQLQDNLTMGSTRTFTLTAGTLSLNGKILSTGLFSASNTNARTIAFGTSSITVTGNSGTIWTNVVDTNLTITGTPVVNCAYAGSTGTRSIGLPAYSSYTATPISFNITAGSDNFSLATSGVTQSVNFTGFSGSISGLLVNILGDLTIPSTATISQTSTSSITFRGNSGGTQKLTTGGASFGIGMGVVLTGGTTFQLQDNLTVTSTTGFSITSGTVDLNNKTLTAPLVTVSGSTTRAINFQTSSIVVVNGSGIAWNATGSGYTSSGSGTISMTSASAKTFAGGGFSYPTLSQDGSGALTITGSNTFANIANTVQPATVTLTAGTTQTVTSFTLSGTSGNLVTLNSDTAGTQATITYSGSGTVTRSYLNIKDNNAKPNNTFIASNSVNLGNNTGWSFGTSPSNSNFLMLF